MEIIRERVGQKPIKIAIFDFDGTISTLRANWEGIMEPLMLELICPLGEGESYPQELVQKVRDYIDESTGIQTAYQMEWLKNTVESYGKNHIKEDIWWYKDQYNVRLLNMVNERMAELDNGAKTQEDYRMQGSLDFVKALHEKGVEVYIASGTDHKDLVNEVEVLGLSPYVKAAKGAPERQFACSKEEVLGNLLEQFPADEVVMLGDGKVEIMLGHKAGALTVGTATNETDRKGVNEVKREKLVKAGADVIVGDFLDKEGLLKLMKLA